MAGVPARTAPSSTSTHEAFRRPRHEVPLFVRPDERRHFDVTLGDANAVHRRRPTAARAVADRARRRDDRAALGVLDVVYRFLVVVATEHQIDTHLGERAENAFSIL